MRLISLWSDAEIRIERALFLSRALRAVVSLSPAREARRPSAANNK